jgi:adenine-specific DNA methylase
MPMKLCNDTGILPHRNIAAKYCVFNQFGARLSADEVTNLFILPFVESFIELINRRSFFLPVLSELKSEIDRTPIRVILRETSEYYAMLANKENQSQISEEEKVQLLRGDIPYFFAYLGRQELFYYVDAEGHSSPVKNPHLIGFDANRVILHPNKLIESQRLTSSLVYSALWLAKKITPTDFHLVTPDFSLEKSGGYTKFIFDGQTFSAK